MPMYRVRRTSILIEEWLEWADNGPKAAEAAVERAPDAERILGDIEVEADPEWTPIRDKPESLYLVRVRSGLLFEAQVTVRANSRAEAEKEAVTNAGHLEYNDQDEPVPVTYAEVVDRIE